MDLTDLIEVPASSGALTNIKRVGILSDTHASTIEEMPTALSAIIKSVDLIVHAGDYTSKALLDELQNLGIPFHGVYGNLDPPAVRDVLPAEDILELRSLKIGIAHPAEGGPPRGIERRLRSKFRELDVMIYGHTHVVVNKVEEGVLYINPGSAVGKLPAPYPSIAVLELYPKLKVMIHRA